MLDLATFGSNKSDLVLAEHLNVYPEQANWACRAISKATSLLHEFDVTELKNKKFARTIFGLIRCSILKHVNNPPTYIDDKTKTYTANIISRHLKEHFKKHFKQAKSNNFLY